MESPQIKPRPEQSSQCSRRASVSRVWLHRPGIQNISYHSDCDTSRLLLENKSFFNTFALTKPPFQDLLLAFGIFLMFFFFRRQAYLKKSPLSLFSVSIESSFRARVTSLKSPASPQFLTWLGCQRDFHLE